MSSSSYSFSKPMRLIWLKTSNKPNVIIMAINVKRFIITHIQKVSVLLFVGLMICNVKGALAQTYKDEVISLTLPFELHLKKTGQVRLAGLLYQAGSNALEQIINSGDKVRVRLLSDKPDRYGRKPVHLYDQAGHWVQGQMVRHGDAIPYPYIGEESFIRDLYLLEKPQWHSALDDKIIRNEFDIIQGVVIDVAQIKGTTYLNFGSNWRDDFTIRINKATLKKFNAFGFDLPTLKGKNVRIRGWVIEQNGPMIIAEHPSQIEVIAP